MLGHKWVVLTLDTAEGREFNETLGNVESHAELRVSQIGLLFDLGMARFKVRK